MGFLIAPAASDLCIAHNLWPLPTMKSWVEVEGYIAPRTEIDIETENSNKSMIKKSSDIATLGIIKQYRRYEIIFFL